MIGRNVSVICVVCRTGRGQLRGTACILSLCTPRAPAPRHPTHACTPLRSLQTRTQRMKDETYHRRDGGRRGSLRPSSGAGSRRRARAQRAAQTRPQRPASGLPPAAAGRTRERTSQTRAQAAGATAAGAVASPALPFGLVGVAKGQPPKPRSLSSFPPVTGAMSLITHLTSLSELNSLLAAKKDKLVRALSPPPASNESSPPLPRSSSTSTRLVRIPPGTLILTQMTHAVLCSLDSRVRPLRELKSTPADVERRPRHSARG